MPTKPREKVAKETQTGEMTGWGAVIQVRLFLTRGPGEEDKAVEFLAALPTNLMIQTLTILCESAETRERLFRAAGGIK